MSDTRGLLSRISGLRERLVEGSPVANVAGLAERLEADVVAGGRIQVLLDGSLRQISGLLSGESPVGPTQLTARARRLLVKGRELVARLRELSDDPSIAEAHAEDCLAQGVRRVAAMTESALRLVQAFPDAPSAQLRLSEGLDGLLDAANSRIGALAAAVGRRRRDAKQVNALVHLLTCLAAGHAMTLDPFTALADDILAGARQGDELRFLSRPSASAMIAAHSLNVAHVLAHIAPHDRHYGQDVRSAIVAGLLHDVGMLTLSAAQLESPEPWSDDVQRQAERHAQAGSEIVGAKVHGAGPLVEGIAQHHERLDGTGYPAAVKLSQVCPLGRLLAVADVYAAQVADRPHRPARDPRTALTDTLMAGEKGELDRTTAGLLLNLGFHPLGSIVELADGRLGRVVAVHSPIEHLHAPARPVVTILTNEQGQLCSAGLTVDLLATEGHAIVRTLPLKDRLRHFGERLPELCA